MVSILAQAELGTKSSGASATMATPGLPIWPTLAVMVFIFLLLKWVAPALHKRGLRRLNATLGSSIKVEESATFPGGTLYLVEIRGRTLLIGQSPTGVTCLADLTEPSETKAQPAFFELVDSAAKAVVAPQEKDEKLRRLERLLGR
jgi:hypothetical protein